VESLAGFTHNSLSAAASERLGYQGANAGNLEEEEKNV
jgi:hypothetical protein